MDKKYKGGIGRFTRCGRVRVLSRPFCIGRYFFMLTALTAEDHKCQQTCRQILIYFKKIETMIQENISRNPTPFITAPAPPSMPPQICC